MKKIGFIDYYISEWHANNYPAWIKQCDGDFEVSYVWAEEYVSPVDGRNTDEWCKAFGAEKCATIEELCEKSDYIVILAPSNPEKHLAYAKEALKCAKNTYIDKTFAPDLATAKEIFDIAERYGTKFFSTSALRYATELDALIGADGATVTGGGRSIEEYIIHQAEILVKLTDSEPVAVRVEKQGEQYLSSIKMENGKCGGLLFAEDAPFGVYTKGYTAISSDFFRGLIADMLRFFDTGSVSFDTAQTLKVMKIREGIIRGKEALGEWIIL
jgi:hypothetical protein